MDDASKGFFTWYSTTLVKNVKYAWSFAFPMRGPYHHGKCRHFSDTTSQGFDVAFRMRYNYLNLKTKRCN